VCKRKQQSAFDCTAIAMICVQHFETRHRKTRVGQNHIYTEYVRYFWQGNHQIYGHIGCIYTVLANTKKDPTRAAPFL